MNDGIGYVYDIGLEVMVIVMMVIVMNLVYEPVSWVWYEFIYMYEFIYGGTVDDYFHP